MALTPWPSYAEDEIAAVADVLHSGRVNYWTGEAGRRFEAEFAARHGAAYAVAVANGTLALELALVALGIGPGDAVVVPPRSFFATASAVVARGATPVFADLEGARQTLDPQAAEAALTPHTKALLPVHLDGWPADLPALRELCERYGLALIEDCAQAHGAAVGGHPVGAWGDAAAFSFCTDKIMSTGGEGGMLLLHDRAAWARAWAYKDHGKSWEAVYERSHPPGYRWLHDGFGSNWRLTEMQAALGRRQLAKLDGWLVQRRANAGRLRAACAGFAGVHAPWPAAGIDPAFYKYTVFVGPQNLAPGWSRDAVRDALQARGLPARDGVCPELYREAAFAGSAHGPCPVAHRLGTTSLQLPVHPTLTEADLTALESGLAEVLAQAHGKGAPTG